MMPRSPRTLLFVSCLLFAQLATAETLYVTDRILLGVHQQASETSPVISTIASGTAVNVIEKQDSFARIKLADGSEGWVSSGYLKASKPAGAELDTVYAKLQEAQESNKKLSDDLNKLERENQVRRDEISNAKTTIKNLQQALKDADTGGAPAVAAVPTDNKALDEANAQVKALEEKLAQLEKEKTELASHTGDTAVVELSKLQDQNKEFQARIEAALANLKGETVPTAAELAAIRPSFPIWYWLLLAAMLVIGIAGGVLWFDYQHRRRHGGFRI